MGEGGEGGERGGGQEGEKEKEDLDQRGKMGGREERVRGERERRGDEGEEEKRGQVERGRGEGGVGEVDMISDGIRGDPKSMDFAVPLFESMEDRAMVCEYYYVSKIMEHLYVITPFRVLLLCALGVRLINCNNMIKGVILLPVAGLRDAFAARAPGNEAIFSFAQGSSTEALDG